MSVGLTGQSITSASFAPVTVADLTVGLTGQSITASQGTAFAPNDTVQPSGLSITSAQGTAGAISSQEVTVIWTISYFIFGTAQYQMMQQ